MNENKKEKNSGVDPDVNGLHNHDGDDFTDELIEFFEQNQNKTNTEKNKCQQDVFAQIDRQHEEMQDHNEKSTHLKDWEGNNSGLNYLFDERDLKNDEKQQKNQGFKR